MDDTLYYLFLFLVPLLGTEIIELAAARVLFRISDRDSLLSIFYVNLVTNPLLNLILFASLDVDLYLVLLLPLEAAVCCVEAVLFRRTVSYPKPWRLALGLNGLSFGIGVVALVLMLLFI